MRVLFADDDYDIRQIIHSMFAISRHEVQTVTNRADAVATFAQQEFDAVVLDLDMPVLDGMDALRAIRATTRGEALPIVLFTAHYKFQLEESARREGATLLVHKPFAADDFISLLEQVAAA